MVYHKKVLIKESFTDRITTRKNYTRTAQEWLTTRLVNHNNGLPQEWFTTKKVNHNNGFHKNGLPEKRLTTIMVYHKKG